MSPPYLHLRTHPTPAEVDGLFDLQRRSDPFGERLHLALACIALVLAGFPTTVVEWAMLPLAICTLIRMTTHFRVLGPLFWDPVARLTLALTAWTALSRLWTAGTFADWLGDFQNFRFALVIIFLYPVLDHRRTLILALVLGLLCGQISQVSHFIGVQFDLPALTWHRFNDRISGWWDPVIAGSLLCACLGLALGAFLPLPEGGGRGVGKRPTGVRAVGEGAARRRVLSILFIILTLFSLIITGTRGAWLAAAALIVITLLLLLLEVPRLDRRFAGKPCDRAGQPPSTSAAPLAVQSGGQAVPPRRSRRTAIVLAFIPLLIIAASLASPSLRHRLDRGITEVRAAITTSNYESDTGRRIAMWKWAIGEFESHPVRGVGAGGFLPYARAHAADTTLPLPHAHAHSLYFHTAATLGLVGLAILAALLIVVLRSSLMPGGWCLMPALLGLALAGLFDSILINQQTANLFFILVAMNVRYRPRPWAYAEEAERSGRG